MVTTPMEINGDGMKEEKTAAVSVDEGDKQEKKKRKKIREEINSIQVMIVSISKQEKE